MFYGIVEWHVIYSFLCHQHYLYSSKIVEISCLLGCQRTVLSSYGLCCVVVVPAPTIQIAAHDVATTQGLQTITMSNVSSANSAATAGATIVQYAQSPDGQFFIPGIHFSTSNLILIHVFFCEVCGRFISNLI